jgi:hypothetical protein
MHGISGCEQQTESVMRTKYIAQRTNRTVNGAVHFSR